MPAATDGTPVGLFWILPTIFPLDPASNHGQKCFPPYSSSLRTHTDRQSRIQKLTLRWLVSAIFLSLINAASAQDALSNAGVPEQTGDSFTIGNIAVDKRARTVRFPATVNLLDATLEYLLVTDEGKTHESLLSTKVSPYQLHVAMLLLGVKPTLETPTAPPEQLNADTLKTAPELKGDKVDVLISWKTGATSQQAHAEEWIDNSQTKAPMTRGPWIYTGSMIFEKKFLAQVEGSIIALVSDPVALINNPRAGHNDDSIWSARKSRIPAVGTSVEVTFQLLTSPPTNPKPAVK